MTQTMAVEEAPDPDQKEALDQADEEEEATPRSSQRASVSSMASSMFQESLPQIVTEGLPQDEEPMTPMTPSKGESKRSGGGFGQFVTRSSPSGEEETKVSVREKLKRILDNPATQGVSGTLIIITVGLIVLDTNARAQGSQASMVEEIAMGFCFVAYVLEVALTMYVEGLSSLTDCWNYIDLVVIITGAFDYAMTLMQTDNGFEVLRLLRICRLLRLGRLLRALKLLQRVGWLKEVYILCMMMASCLRTLLWSFMLCFFVMTLWSVLAVELLNDMVIDINNSKPWLWEGCERCPRSFSSIWEANWTFFQTIVAGDSWGLVALPVIEKNAWASLVLVGALASIVFGVLNLIAAVVIDTFAERRAKDISSMASDMEYEEVQEKKALGKMFQLIDEDRSGALSIEELREGAEKVCEFRNYLRVLDIDDNDLGELFGMIDYDGSGEVDSEEFIEALYRMKHTDPKTATRFVKHMVAGLFDKQVVLRDRLDGIQNNVLERLSALETKMVDDLDNTVKLGATSNQQEVQTLLQTHAQQIDETVSKAVENAAAVTLNAAMDSAIHKASQAIRQVVLASSSRTAAISDRIDQMYCQGGSEFNAHISSFSRQVTPLTHNVGGMSRQITGESGASQGSNAAPQPQGAKMTSLWGRRSSLFKKAKATFPGPSWVASRPVQVGEMSANEIPVADHTKQHHLATQSFDSMTTHADSRIVKGSISRGSSPRAAAHVAGPPDSASRPGSPVGAAGLPSRKSSPAQLGLPAAQPEQPVQLTELQVQQSQEAELIAQLPAQAASQRGPAGPQYASSAKVTARTTKGLQRVPDQSMPTIRPAKQQAAAPHSL